MADSTYCHFVFDFKYHQHGTFVVNAHDVGRSRFMTFEAEIGKPTVHSADQDVALDLRDLALAIHVSDRIAKRLPRSPCVIDIILDLRLPEAFTRAHDSLMETLRWLTGDTWQFTFRKRSCRDGGQYGLISNEASHIALWSGGLDSLAGLLVHAEAYPESKIILAAIHSDHRVYSDQKCGWEGVLTEARVKNTEFRHIPLRSTHNRTMRTSGWKTKPNAQPRSRGLVFMLIGSAIALLEKSSSLKVFENGIGAINLPFHGAEERDHSRSVHPRTMMEVEKLIQEITGTSLSFETPYLFSTKGDLCKQAFGPETEHLLLKTVSCDRRPRRTDLVDTKHCGWCSSCLLRRVGLHAAEIDDQTQYAPYCKVSNTTQHHFLAMALQVQELEKGLGYGDPWQGIVRAYPSLWGLPHYAAQVNQTPRESIPTAIANMYGRYVAEWKSAQARLKHELPDPIIHGASVDWTT